MVVFAIGIVVGFIFSSLLLNGTEIGSIVVDDDLVYLAFNQGHNTDELRKMTNVRMQVITRN